MQSEEFVFQTVIYEVVGNQPAAFFARYVDSDYHGILRLWLMGRAVCFGVLEIVGFYFNCPDRTLGCVDIRGIMEPFHRGQRIGEFPDTFPGQRSA